MGNHDELIRGIQKQLKPIFSGSGQGVYIYLDDLNKVCNEKFASMLGYKSAQEWGNVEENFPSAFVATSSQKKLVSIYQDAIENFNGAKVLVEWKKKSGGTVKADVILVPITYEGHKMALHFVSA